jgi:hypothetical protein
VGFGRGSVGVEMRSALRRLEEKTAKLLAGVTTLRLFTNHKEVALFTNHRGSTPVHGLILKFELKDLNPREQIIRFNRRAAGDEIFETSIFETSPL